MELKTTKILFLVVTSSITVTHMLFGIYLSILWVVNMKYKNNFPFVAPHWKTSFLCVLAFSLVVLYHFLVTILILFFSVMRLWVVLKPFESRNKSPQFAVKGVVVCVTISVSMSVVCSTILPWDSKIVSGMCLPFVDNTPLSTAVLVLQVTTVLVVTCSHIMLLKALKDSKEAAGQSSDLHFSTYFQLILLNLSYLFSWILPDILYLVASFLPEYPTELVLWAIVLVVPLNSLINPVIFMATN